MTDIADWIDAAEKRYLADLTFQEARKALQALSLIYTQKRDKLGAALDSKGKRAAFAYFYGPLHFMLVREVVAELGAAEGKCTTLVDVGCGTGAAGIAWGAAFADKPTMLGVDVDAWAVKEAPWTYGYFGLRSETRRQSAEAVTWPEDGAVLAAYTMNELSDDARNRFLEKALAARRSQTLILEPIAKSPVPWWSDWSKRIESAGGRADEWSFPANLPARLRLMDKAAGLRHDRLKGRTLYLPRR